MYNMGVFHASSRHGFSEDMATAAKYWKGASDLGHEEAMFRLGTLHKGGSKQKATASSGVGHSELEAFKLYKEAAEKGDVNAMCVVCARSDVPL